LDNAQQGSSSVLYAIGWDLNIQDDFHVVVFNWLLKGLEDP
jgi:hypothetical protein